MQNIFYSEYCIRRNIFFVGKNREMIEYFYIKFVFYEK